VKWLGIIKTIIEIVIPLIGHIKKHKAEKELEAVATGVEAFSMVPGHTDQGRAIKQFIRDIAEKEGVEQRLNKRIKRLESKLLPLKKYIQP